MKNLMSMLLLLCFSQRLLAQVKMGDFQVADKIEVEGSSLLLNGTEFRKAGFFNTKVYLGALYLPAKEKNADLILASSMVKVIDVWPLYGIDASDSRKGWDHSIKENCTADCEALQVEIQNFLNAVGEFKVKDHHRYVFSKDGLRFFNNDKLVFASANFAFAKLLLSTWLGKKPPTEELKKALLGG